MNSNNSNRVKWVHLRLSPAEHKIVMQRREKSTCRNLSQYLRNVLLDRPIVSTYRNLSQDDMMQQMAVLNQELNAIGNNLNQVTKRLHTLRPSEAIPDSADLQSVPNIINKKKYLTAFFKGDMIHRKPMLRHYRAL